MVSLPALLASTSFQLIKLATGAINRAKERTGVIYKFIFTLENDSLTGVFSSELGDSPLENLKFEDNKLSCDFTIEMADGELYLEVEFDVEENEMTGNVFADMGDYPITATKRKEEEKKN